MATKKTNQKPMSLYNPSAMGQGFNMAYKAEMANAPVSNANVNKQIVATQANMLSSMVSSYDKALTKQKEEKDKVDTKLEANAQKLVKLDLYQDYYKDTSRILDTWEKEYIKGDYGDPKNKKKKREWDAKYSRFMKSTAANKKNLTLAATMIAHNQHNLQGMSMEDSQFLLGVSENHLGESGASGVTVTEDVSDDGGVTYNVSYTDPTTNQKVSFKRTEHDLSNLVGAKKDLSSGSSIQTIIENIRTKSKNVTDTNEVRTEEEITSDYNDLKSVFETSENPAATYNTLITGTYGSQTKSFVEELENTDSPLFASVLKGLQQIPGMVSKFDEDDSGTLDKEDFTESDTKNLLALQKEIKSNWKVGHEIYMDWINSTENNNAYEVGKGEREAKQDTLSVGEKNALKLKNNFASQIKKGSAKYSLSQDFGEVIIDPSKAAQGKGILFKYTEDYGGDEASRYVSFQEYLNSQFGAYQIMANDPAFKNSPLSKMKMLPGENKYIPE
tara:strand:- start:9710 stop:11212 length:1503 start_codon:yes stop_codon:yes gene_type:complete